MGNNIKSLRLFYRETLQELGDFVGAAKSTIKGYENGSRTPDPEILKKLAAHYGKTVDEIMYSDLTGLIPIDESECNIRSLLDKSTKIMPLLSSDELMKNKSFSKGYEYCHYMLTCSYKGEVVRGTILGDIYESFANALDETNAPEAVANLLWVIYIWWNSITDEKNALDFQTKLYSNKVSATEMLGLNKNLSPETEKKRMEFLAEFEPIVFELIGSLKSDSEWTDLGDYYLALKYMINMVDNDLPYEMNLSIGKQMLLSFLQLNNKYAASYLKPSK